MLVLAAGAACFVPILTLAKLEPAAALCNPLVFSDQSEIKG